MIAVRFVHRHEWEAKLKRHGYVPLEGLGPLSKAVFWKTSWGHVFTVPVDEEDRVEAWDLQKVHIDAENTKPPGSN